MAEWKQNKTVFMKETVFKRQKIIRVLYIDGTILISFIMYRSYFQHILSHLYLRCYRQTNSHTIMQISENLYFEVNSAARATQTEKLLLTSYFEVVLCSVY